MSYGTHRRPLFNVALVAAAVCGLALLGALVSQPQAVAAQQDRSVAASEDAAVQAWLQKVAPHINDSNMTVRRSAQQAVVAVGEPALPVLRRISQTDDAELASTARLLAQRIQHGERVPPGTPLGRALASLELTPARNEQVTEIVSAHQEKVRELMQQARGGEIEREEVRARRAELQDQMVSELRRVLNEEQIATIRRAVDAPAARGGDRPGARPDGRPGGDRPQPRGDRPQRQRGGSPGDRPQRDDG